MNAETLRELLGKQPFQPFEVVLSTGEVHSIRHPEFAFVLRSNLVIGYPDTDRVAICSLLNVARVSTLGPVAS